MMATLKSEIRKLLTTRATYIWVAIAYAFLLFVSFWGEGFKSGMINGPDAQHFLADTVTLHAILLGIIGAILAMLLMTQEYRHNTILYSITLANRRSKVLWSKIIAVLVFDALFALVGGILGLLGIIIGVHLAGHVSIPPQDNPLLTYFGKMIFYCEGWALAALMIGALLRNQVAALAFLLIVPNTIEGLLSLVLKHYSVYLPFSALSQVTQQAHGASVDSATGSLSPIKGAVVFGIYLIVGWIITFMLFSRRDAT